MSFNTLIDWNSCSPEQQRALLTRPAISASDSITRTVSDILDNVKTRGDDALREYSAKFDKTALPAGYASRLVCRSVYSRRLGSALLNGADAGDAGAHCGMPEGGSVLAAAHR